MPNRTELATAFSRPDYEYGNHSHIEVVRLLPWSGEGLDPHASLEHKVDEIPAFSEEALENKIREEVAGNYQVIGDPKSTESNPKQFGITILNRDRVDEGKPVILTASTSASSLYDARGNPNNEGNAVELAYAAFKYPEQGIVYVETPGNGNSTDFEVDEYSSAVEDGKLIHETRDDSGKIIAYEACVTIQALVRALTNAGISVSHLSSNATAAHFSSALATALPPNSLKRGFFYNPSNISDRNAIAMGIGSLREIFSQRRYQKLSKDPLRLTGERKDMARKALSGLPKRKLDQIRASTHNPAKLSRQQKIFRNGNERGQSAAVHTVAAQMQHAGLRQTFVFPEFASQYKRPEDFKHFIRLANALGGHAVDITDVESLRIPLGQYGHSHYPSVRQTLESFAFNRR